MSTRHPPGVAGPADHVVARLQLDARRRKDRAAEDGVNPA